MGGGGGATPAHRCHRAKAPRRTRRANRRRHRPVLTAARRQTADVLTGWRRVTCRVMHAGFRGRSDIVALVNWRERCGPEMLAAWDTLTDSSKMPRVGPVISSATVSTNFEVVVCPAAATTQWNRCQT